MQKKKLKDIVYFQEGPGVRKWQFRDKGIKLLNVSNIVDGNLLLSNSSRHLEPKEVKDKYSHFLLRENDIVMASSGATWGKTAVVDHTHLPLCLNTSTIRFRSLDENILSRNYLLWFLKSSKFLEQISRLITGSAQPNFGSSHLSQIIIEFPDLQTQKQIASILEDADRARQQRKSANELTEQFLQSSFLHLFGDPVMNEKGWQVVKIRDIATEAKYGTSKPAQPDGQYPYLRMNNITYSGKWDFSDLKFISLEESEKDKYLLKRDDLVFNRTNSKELVGKTAVYKRNEEMAIAGYLIRVRLNEKALPEYVSAYLNSSYGKELLKSMCKNIIGMANINAQELQNISLPLPPLSLQQQFASLVADTEILRQKQLECERELEHLFQALLQQYFSSEAGYVGEIEGPLSQAAESEIQYAAQESD